MNRAVAPLVVASLLLGGAAKADAQMTRSGSPTQAPAPSSEKPPVQLDTVRVVGTHLRRADLDTQHPTLVLTRDDLLRSGLSAVGDILQRLPINGQTQNRNINTSGRGEVRLNLRSLGANRTLVLLDGQRWITTLDGAADLSTIPLALVERIEVLQDGASAIYGSDAIAGVVNIVMRRDFDGVQASAYLAGNEHGDGMRRATELVFGRNGERGNVVFGLEYGRDDPILARDRAISAVPIYGLPPGATGTFNTPYSFFRPAFSPLFLTLIPGRPGTAPADFRRFNEARDLDNPVVWVYLQTPQERHAAVARARYEFSPTLTASVDALYDRRHSTRQLQPGRLQLAPSLPGPAGQITIAADNLYNPFDTPVPSMFRQLIETGSRRFESSVETTRVHAGLEGVFTIGRRDYAWGADAGHTRARLRQSDGPFLHNARIAQALGPSFRDANGVARCGTPTNVIDGCVPLNVFGGPGSVTPQMLAYVGVDAAHRSGGSDLLDLSLHADGPLFDLPAGPLAFAIGIEHRRESGFDTPSELLVSGMANGLNIASDVPTRGRYSVDEAWLEFDAPLLAGKRWAHSLDLTVAGRVSRYSTFGNAHTLQAGLRWKPFADLLVRANHAQGFRAPSLAEAFRGQQAFPGFFDDPCAASNRPTPQVLARCQADGATTTVPARPVATALFGGNRQLQPETARNRSLGVVYSPRAAPGLELSLDWYRIQLHNAIGEPNPQGLINGCYLLGDARACTRITRDAAGQLRQTDSSRMNLADGQETEGYDLAIDWHRETRFGRVGARLDANYTRYFGELGQPARLTPHADGSVAIGNRVGSFGGAREPNPVLYWRLRSLATLRWQRARWNASLSARYFSRINEDCSRVVSTAAVVGDASLRRLCSEPDRIVVLDASGIGQAAPRNRVASVTYVDVEAGWVTPWRAQITVGARNALDRDPPLSRSAFNSFFSDYDVPGRFWYLRYQQSW